ncbi:MAG TPA: ATP-dependent Clp protease adaptor ClpS [Candidatus Nitrosotenuis sp.]|jgi:ATP-dependent Clp protease adapter protein ClpS|nr:ATP-dependent Clp protease adaptor ClpS [Candidatus Nitrosotenuis sp.]
MLATVVLPDLEIEDRQKLEPRRSWRVILYNDDVHLIDDVVLWVQKATGHSLERAVAIVETAHRTGRAVCYEGDKEDCHKVARYLRGHGLQVEVDSCP